MRQRPIVPCHRCGLPSGSFSFGENLSTLHDWIPINSPNLIHALPVCDFANRVPNL